MNSDRPSLFDQPVARSTDPETSHEAAASIRDRRPRQAAILNLLRFHGPLTDEEIADRYDGPPQSPSGLRTRRAELVDVGLVVDSGERVPLRSGRRGIVWEAAPRWGRPTTPVETNGRT